MNQELPVLNLPVFELNFFEKDGKAWIYDKFRKKNILLTPEEWVRQNLLLFLIEHKSYPASLLKIEKSIKVNNLLKRFDAVFYSKTGSALLLIECKAPNIKVNQAAFEQIAWYNFAMNVPYLLVSNGLQHYCCAIDFEKKNYQFLPEIPSYTDALQKILL